MNSSIQGNLHRSRVASLIKVFSSCKFSCRRPALPQKSWAISGSALPPDVRRWLYPADSCQIIPGRSPWSGLSPSDLLCQRQNKLKTIEKREAGEFAYYTTKNIHEITPSSTKKALSSSHFVCFRGSFYS